jgi:predicted ATPase
MITFQIGGLHIDGETIGFSKNSSEGENVFTLLVGKNASGKSRILSKVVNSVVFSNSGEELVLHANSSRAPSKVVAVSTNLFDRFPQPLRMGPAVRGLRSNYTYLGVGGIRSSPLSMLSQSCESLLSGFIYNEYKAVRVADIFSYLGFAPLVSFEFRRSGILNYKNDMRDAYFETYRKNKRAYKVYENESSLELVREFDNEIWPRIEFLLKREPKSASFSLRLDLREPAQTEGLWEYVSAIVPLLKYGIYKVSNLVLFDLISKDKRNFRETSSGQQCMILMILGIAGAIENGSLICIDEPEVSLHPQWQTDFIGILQEVFSEYHGCHFLIATHSPQIVAGLTSRNGYVVDLERKELSRSAEYSEKSADYQLAEIFQAPGFKNEYLVRVVLVLLSKISRKEDFSQRDWRSLSALSDIKEKLSERDPVWHMIGQAETLARK